MFDRKLTREELICAFKDCRKFENLNLSELDLSKANLINIIFNG